MTVYIKINILVEIQWQKTSIRGHSCRC